MFLGPSKHCHQATLPQEAEEVCRLLGVAPKSEDKSSSNPCHLGVWNFGTWAFSSPRKRGG